MPLDPQQFAYGPNKVVLFRVFEDRMADQTLLRSKSRGMGRKWTPSTCLSCFGFFDFFFFFCSSSDDDSEEEVVELEVETRRFLGFFAFLAGFFFFSPRDGDRDGDRFFCFGLNICNL